MADAGAAVAGIRTVVGGPCAPARRIGPFSRSPFLNGTPRGPNRRACLTLSLAGGPVVA